jgi:energy-coupling factor transport system ATP-binding protein
MDRTLRGSLADRLRGLSDAGAAVVVATHDPEFAVAVADRVVLLAEGRVIADGPTEEVLGGGWYFSTETARILGGAHGALVPEAAEALLRSEEALAR